MSQSENKEVETLEKANSTNSSGSSFPTVKKDRPKIFFFCGDCGLSEEADYYGRKPPFCRNILFHEDSYICRDPFSAQASNNANFLLLGSNCTVCNEMTCQECSVFYTKRLCGKCSKSAVQYLPQQLKISKANKDE